MKRELISICIALALASTSYGVVIGNWDFGDDGWKTGSDAGWGNGGTLLVPGQPIVFSGGTGIAGVNAPAGFWWEMVFATWNEGAPVSGPVIGDYTKFEIDTERLQENYPGATWGQIAVKIEIQYDDQGTNEGSGIWQGKQFDDLSQYFGGDQFNHIVLDYSELLLEGETIWNFQIAVASNGNGTGSQTTLWDNAQLTPEPATMALLGLGGLALIRRKK